MISEERAEALRLYKIEKWPVGTIARQFGVHHSTIKRLLCKDSDDARKNNRPVSMLDPYVGFIKETVRKYPQIKATRVWHMIKERGYPGKSPTPIQEFVRSIRVSKKPEAFLKLQMLPGEQAQVDWAYFGRIEPKDPNSRKICAFLMTLSYSRMTFLKFFLAETQIHFQQGHVDAFEYFGGVPRSILIDNLKSGVTERVGSIIRFNESYLAFATHFGFEPKAANIRRGNEKGRVERSVRYVRDSFFAARTWNDLDELNRQAEDWCLNVAGSRKWPQDSKKTVFEAFQSETLLARPRENHAVLELKFVRVGKTPYIRYDCNEYSVPAKYVRELVQVQACTEWVRVHYGNERITVHRRSYKKKQVIEHPEHLQEVLADKKRAKKHFSLHRLQSLVPNAEAYLKTFVREPGSIQTKLKALVVLLDDYGAEALQSAIEIALKEKRGSVSTLRYLTKQADRKEIQSTVPTNAAITKYGEKRVEQHDLKTYDSLSKKET